MIMDVRKQFIWQKISNKFKNMNHKPDTMKDAIYTERKVADNFNEIIKPNEYQK